MGRLDRSHRAARRPAGRGFTLVEALVSLAIIAITASALLISVSAGVQTGVDTIDETIALGIAETLMDEILGQRYAEAGAGPYEQALTPSEWESQGEDRERFNDIDDYNGYQASLVDRWGVPLGKDDGVGGVRRASFRRHQPYVDWTTQVDVYYIDPMNLGARLPAGQVSDYREIVVKVSKPAEPDGKQTLAALKRVVSYVRSP